MTKLICQRIKESFLLKKSISQDKNLLRQIEKISQNIVNAIKSKNKIIFVGNGGSFADSIHLAAEFVGRFSFDRPPLPAIALGCNNSTLSAIGNDYSFEEAYLRELVALGKNGDILIAISTGGNSKNIIRTVEKAKAIGMKVYGLTGRNGGKMKDICECIQVPSDKTARIQEAHIMIGHIICEIVEKKIFSK